MSESTESNTQANTLSFHQLNYGSLLDKNEFVKQVQTQDQTRLSSVVNRSSLRHRVTTIIIFSLKKSDAQKIKREKKGLDCDRNEN